MWLETLRESKGDEARCPTCQGAVCKRVRGKMHAGSFLQDGQRLDICRVPNEHFSDPIVLDAITQYFDGGLYRMWPSERYLSRGGKKLHRDVWVMAFGDVPKNCHIHHRDRDTVNNRLENLECLPAKQHLVETWAASDKARPGYQHFTDDARDKAAEWHASEAGRLWHSRHAKRAKSWTKWERKPLPCQFCAKVFDCLVRKSGNTQKYCSQKCKAASYRQRNKA